MPTVRDAIRLIERDGWFLVRTKGSHRQYKHPAKRGTVTIAGNQNRDVAPGTWNSYGLVHPYARTRRYAWADGDPPRGLERHPVVLISHRDASAATALATSDAVRNSDRMSSVLLLAAPSVPMATLTPAA